MEMEGSVCRCIYDIHSFDRDISMTAFRSRYLGGSTNFLFKLLSTDASNVKCTSVFGIVILLGMNFESC